MQLLILVWGSPVLSASKTISVKNALEQRRSDIYNL